MQEVYIYQIAKVTIRYVIQSDELIPPSANVSSIAAHYFEAKTKMWILPNWWLCKGYRNLILASSSTGQGRIQDFYKEGFNSTYKNILGPFE